MFSLTDAAAPRLTETPSNQPERSEVTSPPSSALPDLLPELQSEQKALKTSIWMFYMMNYSG